MSAPALIPRPRRVELTPDTRCPAPSLAANAPAVLRHNWTTPGAPGASAQLLVEAWSGPADAAPEAYRIAIDPGQARVSAPTERGLIRAVQTLTQLRHASADHSLPCGHIEDAPAFAWRGLMLDCSRHFISKAATLRLLEQMADLKLNVLHWHLCDDQGWRIEVKSHPRLTEVGAWRTADGGQTHGGFYTQEDVREIVARGLELGVDIMPEIDLPGHATAAIVAYPELGCAPLPPAVATRWGIHPNNFNAGEDHVISTLESILGEIADLFPFPYFHLGGDECLKDTWKTNAACQRRIQEKKLGDEHGLQAWFMGRLAQSLAQRGRRAVGWDEILEGPEIPGMIAQCWRDPAIVRIAAERGINVIAAPRDPCYLDVSVGQLDLPMTHGFDPLRNLSPAHTPYVMGGEACLWTEYVTESQVDERLFPRLAGIAEALWCGREYRPTFADFQERLKPWQARHEASGVRFGPAYRHELKPGTDGGRTDLNTAAPGVEHLGLPT